MIGKTSLREVFYYKSLIYLTNIKIKVKLQPNKTIPLYLFSKKDFD